MRVHDAVRWRLSALKALHTIDIHITQTIDRARPLPKAA
jgi:hypothetical protein